jgi:hypothetical protein
MLFPRGPGRHWHYGEFMLQKCFDSLIQNLEPGQRRNDAPAGRGARPRPALCCLTMNNNNNDNEFAKNEIPVETEEPSAQPGRDGLEIGLGPEAGPGDLFEKRKHELAIALGRGVSVRKWAAKAGVPESTAYALAVGGK